MTVPLRLDAGITRVAWPAGTTERGARPSIAPRRRRIVWTAVLSVVLHAAALAAFLVLLHRRPGVLAVAVEPATMELVMAPPGSDKARPSTSPLPDSHAAPAAGQAAAASAPPPPAPTDADAEPLPAAPPQSPPQPTAPQATQAAATTAPAATTPPAAAAATPPAEKTAPAFDFGAIASDTNALVTGDVVVPASLDRKFNNRRPSYPEEAARHGEQGMVILLIHVAPDGLVSGVDILRSSGYASLDQEARRTALSWHFLPSVKDGQPIEADYPMRISFNID